MVLINCWSAVDLAEGIEETINKLSTLYWSPKLHKDIQSPFIASSSSCTATESSKLSITCLTAIKNRVIK